MDLCYAPRCTRTKARPAATSLLDEHRGKTVDRAVSDANRAATSYELARGPPAGARHAGADDPGRAHASAGAAGDSNYRAAACAQGKHTSASDAAGPAVARMGRMGGVCGERGSAV